MIEFAGGDLLGRGTRIRRVPFDKFARGDPVEAVAHPVTWTGLTYSPSLPPEETIDRAEWLRHNQPPPYRLGYRNCESIAIWCATGDFETFQVKAFNRWRLAFSLPTVWLLRRKPSLGKPLAFAGILLSLLTSVPYVHSRALFEHTRRYPGRRKWAPGAW